MESHGVKGVDTIMGDQEKPKYRCTLVAKRIKKDKREDLFAAGCAGEDRQDGMRGRFEKAV